MYIIPGIGGFYGSSKVSKKTVTNKNSGKMSNNNIKALVLISILLIVILFNKY